MLLAALFSLDLDSDTKEVWKHIKERYGNVQRLVEELHILPRVKICEKER
ncbi:MAG: hypothetical protein ACI9DF_003346 [Verrucomicrobiales bacterium]|jgi:hypothetical protein